MISDAPPFWWIRGDWRGYALAPLAWIYGAIAGRRMAERTAPAVDCPVICVGNFTVGGSGKTPTVIAIARRAKALGRKPCVVTRGHGGSHVGPHLVDLAHDDARSVGDEALLIARHCPVMVAVNRAEGAEAMRQRGHDLVILDDGFQSNRVHIDHALIVVDANRGLGNGLVLPAGPVRAPMTVQLRHADALLVMGEGSGADGVVRRFAKAAKPVITARLKARNVTRIRGKKVLAFAGIGDPERFYGTLGALGAEVVRTRSFPDHYPFKEDDLAGLMREADDYGLLLVTTEKDAVRLTGTGDAATVMRQRVIELPVTAEFEPVEAIDRMIEQADAAARQRQLAGLGKKPGDQAR